MPHINAVFVDNPPNREFIKKRKAAIRQIVSQMTGYRVEDISFVPRPIKPEDLELAENVSNICLIPEMGVKIKNEAQATRCAKKIKAEILGRCRGAKDTDFTVWVRGYPINGHAEHKAK